MFNSDISLFIIKGEDPVGAYWFLNLTILLSVFCFALCKEKLLSGETLAETNFS
jgi:hypothetical protein